MSQQQPAGLSFLQSQDVEVWDFLVNLLIAAVLGWLLSRIYRRFGRSLSEKTSFASNFVPITVTTAMIIAILQTNIVLSLGLVGALSIIRFRTAIKDPEELTYVFFCIAVGLGAGAGQRALTLMGFAVVASVLAVVGLKNADSEARSLLLTVTGPSRVDPRRVADVVKSHASLVDLKRLEEAAGTVELIFVLGLEELDALNRIRDDLAALDGELAWSFADHRPMV